MIDSNRTLLDADVLANPYTFFTELRREDAITWDVEMNAWRVAAYAETRALLRDVRLSSAKGASISLLLPPESAALLSELLAFFGMWMVFSEDPLHQRIRAAATKAARVAMVNIDGLVEARMRAAFSRAANEELIDVAGWFGQELPLGVIADVIGIPSTEHDNLMAWTRAIVGALGRGVPHPAQCVIAQSALGQFRNLIVYLVEERRRVPRHDLITLLCHDETSLPLNDEEVFTVCANLVVAGTEPTRDAIAGGLAALSAHPAEFARLRVDPSLVDTAVEEILRYTCPFVYAGREATGEILSGGEIIQRGDRVLLLLASANRDERVFADAERFDIGRSPNPHLTFGLGHHQCFGAALARLQLRAVLLSVVGHCAELTVVEGPRWRQSAGIRALDTLVLKW